MGILGRVEERTQVELPAPVRGSYEVYVNGVLQHRGQDYEQVGRRLVFMHELRQEGRLGFWRWLLMFLSIAGTYRRNDSVDVQYTTQGVTRVATGLDIQGPDPHAH